MPRTYQVTYVNGAGKIVDYDVDGMRIHEMVAAAMAFMDVRADDCDADDFMRRYDEANRFATFCVSETLDEFGEFCDPRGGFRDLLERWRKSEAPPVTVDSVGSLLDGRVIFHPHCENTIAHQFNREQRRRRKP